MAPAIILISIRLIFSRNLLELILHLLAKLPAGLAAKIDDLGEFGSGDIAFVGID